MNLEELKARDVMNRDIVTVPPAMTVRALIGLFRQSRFTGVPVVDEEQRPIGVVSETDVLRALAYTIQRPVGGSGIPEPLGNMSGAASVLEALANDEKQASEALQQLLSRSTRDLMTPVVFSCGEDDPLGSVCETMAWKRIHRVIVTRDGKVVGLISALDVLRKLGADWREWRESKGDKGNAS